MALRQMILAGTLCLTLGAAQNQGKPIMIGNIRVIVAKTQTLIFRNTYCGEDRGKIQFFQRKSSDVLFTNFPDQSLDNPVLMDDLCKTSANSAFWLDECRCIFDNNWRERKTIVLASGSVVPCDISEESFRMYGVPRDGWFLGRSIRFAFWSIGSMLFRKTLSSGVVEHIDFPSYVERISGVSEMPDGKLLIYASGKNPNFFHWHPGWSGILSLDFQVKKFKRIK